MSGLSPSHSTNSQRGRGVSAASAFAGTVASSSRLLTPLALTLIVVMRDHDADASRAGAACRLFGKLATGAFRRKDVVACHTLTHARVITAVVGALERFPAHENVITPACVILTLAATVRTVVQVDWARALTAAIAATPFHTAARAVRRRWSRCR